MVGSGIGYLPASCATAGTVKENDPRHVSSYFIGASLISLIYGVASITYTFSVPPHSVVAACAFGAHTIGDDAILIPFWWCRRNGRRRSRHGSLSCGCCGCCAAQLLPSGFNYTPEPPPARRIDSAMVTQGGWERGIRFCRTHSCQSGWRHHLCGIACYGLAGDAYHNTALGNGGAVRDAKFDP